MSLEWATVGSATLIIQIWQETLCKGEGRERGAFVILSIPDLHPSGSILDSPISFPFSHYVRSPPNHGLCSPFSYDMENVKLFGILMWLPV